jgi:hypothetical protein
MTGMGTADEQMAVRAQRALMRRMTRQVLCGTRRSDCLTVVGMAQVQARATGIRVLQITSSLPRCAPRT